MNFYITLINYYSDKPISKAIYSSDNEVSALAKFHAYVSSSMNDATCTHSLCYVLADNGNIIAKENFVRPVPVIEEVPATEA